MTILNKKYYNIFLQELTFYLLIIGLSLIPWMEFINSNYKELNNIVNDNFINLIILYILFVTLAYFFIKIIFKKKTNLYHVSILGISIWVFFNLISLNQYFLVYLQVLISGIFHLNCHYF